MKIEVLKFIESEFPKILSKYPLGEYISKDWYKRRVYYLEYNKKILEKLSKMIKEKFDITYTYQELYSMQKLFLMYPDRVPKKLLSLSWDMIQIILQLCDREKRDFYVDMCIREQWSYSELKKYILEDLYEKTIALMEEINDYEVVTNSNFNTKVLDIAMLVWK